MLRWTSWQRSAQIWNIEARIGALDRESPDFARWDLEAAGPNWRVATRYDFLRQEHVIRANLSEPLRRQMPRLLAWALDYVLSGTWLRVVCRSGRFGLHFVHFTGLLLCWLALAAAGGWLVALLAAGLGLPGPVAAVVGLAVALLLLLALRPLADYLYVLQINSAWCHVVAFACGQPSCFEAAIEAGARRVVAAVVAGDADEVVVVGHSSGGVIAPAVIARALDLDPDVGRRGPPVVLLTLGSIASGASLHPGAVRLRAVLARLATEPSIVWIDCKSRKDVLNPWKIDPIRGVGVRIEGERCNPRIFEVRPRDMLTVEHYLRMRFDFFRMHYQFIMWNDRRAPYDYFMLVGGPAPLALWSADTEGLKAVLAPDASYGPGHLPPVPASS